MKDYFKKAMDKLDEEKNAVPVNIELPLEQYMLLEKLTDALDKMKSEGMSIGEVISCIMSSWEAMKLTIDEKRPDTGVLVEFGKKNERPAPPEERIAILKDYYHDLLDDTYKKVTEKQGELDQKQGELESKHKILVKEYERLRTHLLALANFMAKKERENKARKNSYIEELVQEHPELIELESVMQNMN